MIMINNVIQYTVFTFKWRSPILRKLKFIFVYELGKFSVSNSNMTGRDEILLKELIKTTKNPTVKIQPDRQHNARQKTAHLTVSLYGAAAALSVLSSSR